MAMSPGSSPLSLEQLLDAVDQLPPSQLRELERHLSARLKGYGNEGSDEASVIRVANACLHRRGVDSRC